MSSFQRILVGWDGSADSHQAVRTAARLAAEIKADVTVLAVLRPRSRAEAADEAADESAHEKNAVIEEITAELPHDGAGMFHIRHELIEAEQIPQAFDGYVREHGFDLVVLGRHGVDRARRPHIGGVCEHQIRHGSCPVMVVGAN